jgi:hypothetical protein
MFDTTSDKTLQHKGITLYTILRKNTGKSGGNLKKIMSKNGIPPYNDDTNRS